MNPKVKFVVGPETKVLLEAYLQKRGIEYTQEDYAHATTQFYVAFEDSYTVQCAISALVADNHLPNSLR